MQSVTLTGLAAGGVALGVMLALKLGKIELLAMVLALVTNLLTFLYYFLVLFALLFVIFVALELFGTWLIRIARRLATEPESTVTSKTERSGE